MPELSKCQIDPDLLAILACPACNDRPPLTLTADEQFLVCTTCRRKYPIKDGRIPQLIVEDAILEDNE